MKNRRKSQTEEKAEEKEKQSRFHKKCTLISKGSQFLT